MKSSKPSPFNWKAVPASLFTPTEKAHMKSFAVTTNTDRKKINFYSKAGAK
jgi:hypothetical protein